MISSQRERRVAVTGYGAICALGRDSTEIWEGILEHRRGYAKEDHPDPAVVAKFFGFIPYELDMKRFPKSLLKALPRFTKLGISAADEAVRMAFGNTAIDDFYDPFERGVIFGAGWGGLDDTIYHNDEYRAEGLSNPFSNILAMYSVGSAAMSIRWNLRGYQNTPVAACATGSMSIGDAYEIIRQGRAKMMLAGGGESIKGAFNVWTVDILGALSKEQDVIEKACCPFSLDRSGFVMSEGAAVLCLEEYETAKQRGARILGEIVGYGSYSDARDWTSPAPDCLGRLKSIQAACDQARVSGSDIDYINAHGTSTQLNDANETESLKLAFDKRMRDIPVSSTKSYTGHLIAGAGAIESIFCLKTMETGTVPATIHLNNPDPQCDLDYVPNEHRYNQTIDTTLNVNYGFGGTNTALIFRKAH
ncbi:beta-ketoacyl-[acyl-carrier-protein] synthase family protein [Beijerinckiaceae bacterium]|nr:beta-ketoacyl-[acyl-carrier-protein] synthase family protein [Beijerinckiaceae bacterium]